MFIIIFFLVCVWEYASLCFKRYHEESETITHRLGKKF